MQKKPRLKSSLVFLSPEMVKHRGLLALRRQQLQGSRKHSSSFCEVDERQRDRLLAAKRAKETHSEKILPWLGIGFQDAKPRTTALQKGTEARRMRMLHAGTESKVVQVSFSPDCSRRDSAVVASTHSPEPVAGESLPPLPPPALKTVLLGEGIPDDRQPQFDFSAFVEALKRRKPQVEESSERRCVVSINAPSLDVPLNTEVSPCSQPIGLHHSRTVEYHKHPPVKCSLRSSPALVPRATLTLSVESARRSKSAFTMSRVIKHPEKPRGGRKLGALHIPQAPHAIKEENPVPEENTEQTSGQLIELKLKHCPPYRIPVEFHLFRRVKKLSQARLRGLS